MADADGEQFHGRLDLNAVDGVLEVLLQVIARVHEQGGVVHRQAVGDHHQHLALFRAHHDAVVRPDERLAVDVLLQHFLAHHQPEVLAGAVPGVVGGLVDNVAQVVKAPGMGGFALGDPLLP